MREKIRKKGLKRRLFSVVLALAMVLSLMPIHSIEVHAEFHNDARCTTHDNQTHFQLKNIISEEEYLGFTYWDNTGALSDTLGPSWFTAENLPTSEDIDCWWYLDGDYFVKCDGVHGGSGSKACGKCVNCGHEESHNGGLLENECTQNDGIVDCGCDNFEACVLDAGHTGDCSATAGECGLCVTCGQDEDSNNHDPDYPSYHSLIACVLTSGHDGSHSATPVHAHNFTYSASGATLTATCSADGCGLTDKKVSLTLTASSANYSGSASYEGVSYDNLATFKSTTGESDPVVTYYKVSDENTTTGGDEKTAADVRKAVGYYYAKATVSGSAIVAKFTVNKATPTASDLTYTAPSSLGYDGNAKSATVVAKSGISGLGTVTVTYYQDTTLVTNPTDVGTYTVKADVAEGDNFTAATDLMILSIMVYTFNSYKEDSYAAIGRAA